MRHTISGLFAALAVLTVGAAPAMACGGGLFSSGCSPCGQTYVSPCAQEAYTGYGYDYGVATYERLPDPTQYYYVDQGPTFVGPGNFAPYPTYQERAVSGWRGYHGGYGYRGGRYANATTHYYDGAPDWRGPVSYGYRSRMHARPWHAHTGYYGHHRGYGMHHGYMNRGYAHRSMGYGMQHAMPRYSHHAPRHHHYMSPRRYY
ncbi:MAG: hypothetical protein HXX15_21675 [Rhodopseudomonas sp.]|uniref:hypothetical protein n=1 Tax=Rhodopseudomonas sp. TaxID=1078 RepID=UPI00179EB589|nr:hypothetical protein [Rhodopseudomonas sp.]NVN88697.1 hypothetical protein [Rhodopseudomonas sp.]